MIMEEPEFRVFVRIPVPRPAGFVDPPSFVWNAEKERNLWEVISHRPRGNINCTFILLHQLALGFRSCFFFYINVDVTCRE